MIFHMVIPHNGVVRCWPWAEAHFVHIGLGGEHVKGSVEIMHAKKQNEWNCFPSHIVLGACLGLGQDAGHCPKI